MVHGLIRRPILKDEIIIQKLNKENMTKPYP